MHSAWRPPGSRARRHPARAASEQGEPVNHAAVVNLPGQHGGFKCRRRPCWRRRLEPRTAKNAQCACGRLLGCDSIRDPVHWRHVLLPPLCCHCARQCAGRDTAPASRRSTLTGVTCARAEGGRWQRQRASTPPLRSSTFARIPRRGRRAGDGRDTAPSLEHCWNGLGAGGGRASAERPSRGMAWERNKSQHLVRPGSAWSGLGQHLVRPGSPLGQAWVATWSGLGHHFFRLGTIGEGPCQLLHMTSVGKEEEEVVQE
jgi:hypothetical protein